MPQTPDRRDGPLYEEAIYLDTTVAATANGEIRWDGSKFSFYDAGGEFDPSIGVSGSMLGQSWDFDTTTADADPGAGNFRLNNATQASATWMYVSDSPESGADLSTALAGLRSGDRIYVQQNRDSTRYHLFQITGTPTDGTGYYKIPISADTSGSDLENTERCGHFYWFTRAGGSGDVSRQGSTADNQIARWHLTGADIQAGTAAPTYDDDGNVYLDATGSTTSLPRLIGANGFIAGGAIRWQFDNGNTVVQNSHGGAMTIASFHAIVLRGNKGAGAPAFDTDTDKAVLVQGATVGDPILVVRGANSQTAALQEWRDTVSSDTVVLSIDDEGNIVSANNNVTGIKNAGFDSWGTPTVSASAVTVDYTAYQGATISLPTGTTAITLNTPTAGPGAYKLILYNTVAVTGITWVTQGSEGMYGPNGTVAISLASGDRTLIGLIWDGSDWHVVSSQPMQAVSVT